jgi:hypothetical protein
VARRNGGAGRVRGIGSAAAARYASAMEPTTRDIVGAALMVVVLVGLLVLTVALALPPKPA